MINLCFAGDIFPGGVWIYHEQISQAVKDLLSKFDLRIANLESALYDGNAECHIKMNDPKLGNLVFSPEKCVSVLKELNINVVSLANNHVCDCDYEGLRRTIEVLDQNGIIHFGAGRTEEEAKRPAVLTIKGKSICFLGYYPPNWEASYPPKGDVGGLNQFVIENVVDDVKKYKKIYDYVFVVPHWGKEHTIFPLIENVIQLKKIIGAGATGVLGCHSHCPQTSFIYKDHVVAMSMGNFIFPDRFIVSPRKTYYPKAEELSKSDIPITYDFPIVDEMTMVKMRGNGRIGLLCDVSLAGKKVFLKRHYTVLSENNVLEMYAMSKIKKMKIDFVKWLVLCPRFYRFISRVFNKFFRLISIKYRLGTWNAR